MWQLCLRAVASCRPRVRGALRPGQKLLPSASFCPERTRPDGSRASQAPSPPSAPPRQPPFHLGVRWGKGDPAPLSCYINPTWGNIFVSFLLLENFNYLKEKGEGTERYHRMKGKIATEYAFCSYPSPVLDSLLVYLGAIS